MKKIKGFNFVELLLVMVILGVVISLTLPLLNDIKGSESIYRSYLKKATQDVTGAVNMALMRYKYFDGFNKLGNAYVTSNTNTAEYVSDSDGLCASINAVLNGKECNTPDTDNTKKCFSDSAKGNFDTSLPGLKVGKAVWLFEYNDEEKTGENPVYGYIYIDLNGDKAPNTQCKDRYRFIIYQDRAVLDKKDATDTTDDWKCNFEISD